MSSIEIRPDFHRFESEVIRGYREGRGEDLRSDEASSLSLLPGGTGKTRDFSYIAPDAPILDASKCVGCMECVTACPDTALLAKVVEEKGLEERLADAPAPDREVLRGRFVRTAKYHQVPQKKGLPPGMFGLFVDPTKCKGCGECVEVCGDHRALTMEHKTPAGLARDRKAFGFFESLPDTPAHYIQEKVLADMMLAGRTRLYVGGAGSCMGCGEATALRMMMAATGFAHGEDSMGMVCATGCNSVYGSTYPYTPFCVPWTNSLFENAPAVALGVRLRWNQLGLAKKRLWVVGGDGAMLDIGFQALSRLLMSGMDIKVLVLDTQVYSNTGGQASTATFTSQDAKMSAHGKVAQGKSERRKELGEIALMHPDVYVAQTVTAFPNHFYRAILEANAFPGPALVNVYAACQPEHQIADDRSAAQARMAVEGRAFPLFVYDPRKGERLKERLSLVGNPAAREDWAKDAKSGEPHDFAWFARSEGRFRKQFDAEGKPSAALLRAQEDRLKNWRLLQELAGLR